MHASRFGRRSTECPDLTQTGEHDFIVAESPVFMGTEGARSCGRCDRVEVLIAGRWVAFEDYLETRKTTT